MIVIQLSDPHILAPGELLYGRFDTAEFLARAVAEINRLEPLPDVAVITGDLVDHGEPAEYEHLRALLSPLAMPVFVIPGNHDAREPLRAAFAADGYLPADGFLQFTIENYPVRLVALDTLIPGEAGGLLCSERLAWLDHALASAPARPVLLMMHHPPFLTGIDACTGRVCKTARRSLRGRSPPSAGRAYPVRPSAPRDRPPFCRHGRRHRAEHGWPAPPQPHA